MAIINELLAKVVTGYSFAGNSAAILLMFGIIHFNLAHSVMLACTIVESREGKTMDGLIATSSI